MHAHRLALLIAGIAASTIAMLRPIVLQALGWQALHAGAALTSEGALLFCGRSGAGKSTTAYALGQMGWTQVADDQVVWQLHDGRPKVQPLPFKPRLRPLSHARLGDKAAPRSPRPRGRAASPASAGRAWRGHSRTSA